MRIWAGRGTCPHLEGRQLLGGQEVTPTQAGKLGMSYLCVGDSAAVSCRPPLGCRSKSLGWERVVPGGARSRSASLAHSPRLLVLTPQV